jgi:hypothetical protein
MGVRPKILAPEKCISPALGWGKFNIIVRGYASTAVRGFEDFAARPRPPDSGNQTIAR